MFKEKQLNLSYTVYNPRTEKSLKITLEGNEILKDGTPKRRSNGEESSIKA
jgi:hypothetical protein